MCPEYTHENSMSTLHSTKNYQNLETGTNSTEIRKSENCWISEKQTIQVKIPVVSLAAVFSLVTQRSSPQTAVCGEERCVMRLKRLRGRLKFRNSLEEVIPGKKFPKISIYLVRLSSFPEIPENAVQFDTNNFRK